MLSRCGGLGRELKKTVTATGKTANKILDPVDQHELTALKSLI